MGLEALTRGGMIASGARGDRGRQTTAVIPPFSLVAWRSPDCFHASQHLVCLARQC